MLTRSWAIEEHLFNLAELLAKQDSKMDALCATVQHHSSDFNLVQKSLASQQTIVTDMMVKFAKLDKPPAQPLLLPLPTTTPSTALIPAPPSLAPA